MRPGRRLLLLLGRIDGVEVQGVPQVGLQIEVGLQLPQGREWVGGHDLFCIAGLLVLQGVLEEE